MNKKPTILIFLILISFGISAQELDDKSDEPKTLLSDDVEINGFGGLFMDITKIDNDFIHMMGGGGAFIFNRKILIGGYGLGMTTNLDADRGMFDEKEMDFGHGGLWLGYVFFNKSRFHPTLSVLTGWGNISARSVTGYEDRETYDNFFTVSPILDLEINVSSFFKTSIGVLYHIYSGISFSDYTDNDFSNPGIYLSFKLGDFN